MHRVGVVGAGPWVRQVVLPALVRSERTEPVVLWARDPARARELADEHGLEVAPTPADLVERVEAVAFGVPPDVQAPIAAAAARAGRALLLEKPVARTLGEADALIDAVRGTGVRAGVHLSRLLDPAIGGWVAERRGGEWSSASATVLNGALLTDNPFAASAWRNEPDAPVWDLGPHVLSVVLPLLGRVAEVRTERDGDVVRLLTAHADGTTGTLETSMRTEAEREVYTVDGPGGTDRLDAAPFDGVDTYEALARAVLDDEQERCADLVLDLEHSRHAVEVMAAGVASLAAGGSPVRVR